MDCECTIYALNAHLQGAPTSELLARAYLKAPVGQELVASGKAPTHAQAAVFHSQEQHFLLTSRRVARLAQWLHHQPPGELEQVRVRR